MTREATILFAFQTEGLAMRASLRRLGVMLTAIVFLLGAAGRAQAGFEQANLAGTLSADSGFLSTGPFDAVTPFTLTALFDPTMGIPFGQGIELYQTLGQIKVAGFAPVDTNVLATALLLTDPSSTFPANYGVGLLNGGLQGFASIFATATPPFTAAAPVPSVLSGFLGNFLTTTPVPIFLGNGDELLIAGIGDNPTASITAIPEPASLAVLGFGLALLSIRRRRVEESA
ncbi:MAG: PEP-CTERM sorting domain-containing protein [Acetobacteraceae bacterium]